MNNTFLLLYSRKPWSQVWILIYRKWSIGGPNRFIGYMTIQYSRVSMHGNLLNIAFRKLWHVVPLLHIRLFERKLWQSKIGDSWNAGRAAIGACLETRSSAVCLHAAYISYSSTSTTIATAWAASRTRGRPVCSLGFQVGHVDLLVNPEEKQGKRIINFPIGCLVF